MPHKFVSPTAKRGAAHKLVVRQAAPHQLLEVKKKGKCGENVLYALVATRHKEETWVMRTYMRPTHTGVPKYVRRYY